MAKLSWSEFKQVALIDKELEHQCRLEDWGYRVKAVDGSIIYRCDIDDEDNGGADKTDYETNYLPSANGRVSLQKDKDTGKLAISPIYAPEGWFQRLHEIEFMTSKIGGGIHDKNYLNQDYGYSSVDFYEDIGGVETLMVNPTQNDLDTKCIRTDFKWMPDVDYMILSGTIAQLSTPSSDIYMWGLFVDLDTAYGGPQVEVLGGGLNLKQVAARTPVGLKGVAGSVVYKNKAGETTVPEGVGSNRIRFIVRHSVGLQHRLFSIFEIFKAGV